MAIIKGVKKILKSDLPGAPDWFTPVISVLNEFLDTVIGALRGRLGFADNFYGELKTFTFTHAVELEIKTSLPSYGGLLILKTPNEESADYVVTGWKCRQVKQSTLGITINFAGAGTTAGDVSFIVLG